MNRVLAHTGARYPILQAPMGWIARSPLAMAVSRAGGLGIIETSSAETAACQDHIRQMVALGLPFGVNDPTLGWVILGVAGLVWSLYYAAQRDFGNFEDDDSGLGL